MVYQFILFHVHLRMPRSQMMFVLIGVSATLFWSVKAQNSVTLVTATFPRNADLFKMTLGPVKAALEDAGLKNHEVHEIVLVGGSTRIPKIQELLKDANKTWEGSWKMSRTQEQWLEMDFCFPYFEILRRNHQLNPGQWLIQLLRTYGYP